MGLSCFFLRVVVVRGAGASAGSGGVPAERGSERPGREGPVCPPQSGQRAGGRRGALHRQHPPGPLVSPQHTEPPPPGLEFPYDGPDGGEHCNATKGLSSMALYLQPTTRLSSNMIQQGVQ